MTPETGFFASSYLPRVIFLFAALLIAGCGKGEKPVRQDVQSVEAVPPPTVTEWYPSPKHTLKQQQRPAFTASQLSAPMPQEHAANPGYPAPSSWNVPAQQQPPVAVMPPPVIIFQGQQYVPAQAQQGWRYQQPVVQPSQPWYQPQQPYAFSAPQMAQRPWGNVTVPENRGHTGAQMEAWPPASFNAPAGRVEYGTYQGDGGSQYWTIPSASNSGSVW